MSTRVPITRIGAVGMVSDMSGYELPPEAWTSVKNITFEDEKARRCFGFEPVLGLPVVPPYWLIPVFTPTLALWVYGGIGTLYVTDGSTHDVIGSSLGGTRDSRWNGGVFGNIGIFNNGIADPQMWTPPALATNVATLSNWPGSTKCKVIRPFGRYLVAYDISEGANNYPQRVKWSSSAPVGAVPATWDETDPTQDSREWDLNETYGRIIDAKTLGAVNFIYKEDEVHSMTWTGGTFVFRFEKKFNAGLLAQDCVVEYERKHFFASYEDIYVHDGFEIKSVLDKKMRQWYAGRPVNPQRSWMARAGADLMLGFCEQGEDEPNIALVVNLKDFSTSVRDLRRVPYVAVAPIDPAASINVYDSVDIAFDAMIGTFGERTYSPGRDRFVACRVENWAATLVGVSKSGQVFTKTAATAAWDSSFYSTVGYPRCAIRWRFSQVNMNVLVGLDQNPSSSHHYDTVDYGIEGGNDGNLRVYESGASIGIVGTYTTADVISVVYDGANIKYYKNSSVLRTVAAPGLTLFADSSFFTQNSAVNSVTFGQTPNALMLVDQGFDDDGFDLSAYLERTGLAVSGLDRFNNPKVDPTTVKKLTKLWPKGLLQNGTGLKVNVGYSQTANGSITWEGVQTFDPAVSPYLEFLNVAGPFLAVRFESSDDTLWQIDSYDIEIEILGQATP